MDVSSARSQRSDEFSTALSVSQKSLLAVLCLVAGGLALSMRYVPGAALRIVWGLVVAAVFLGLALSLRQRPSLRRYWELSFAFFILSLFVVLDNTVPTSVATAILRNPPLPGNPLASTIGGSVIVQVVEVVITLVVVVGLTKAIGGSLGSISLQWGSFGRALIIGIAGFVFFYGLFLIRPASKFFPTHGAMTTSHVLALTPALLTVVLSNGFLEELVFRGLFRRKYDSVFGPYLANVVQAAIFALAHVGVAYTPFGLLFVALIVFPLGLLLGYLMRSSNGIVAGSLFHAGADIPIYLAFLSYVS
jgi:membrane protease YdiL (CAAX protease family)